jgi:hypothetical protein
MPSACPLACAPVLCLTAGLHCCGCVFSLLLLSSVRGSAAIEGAFVKPKAHWRPGSSSQLFARRCQQFTEHTCGPEIISRARIESIAQQVRSLRVQRRQRKLTRIFDPLSIDTREHQSLLMLVTTREQKSVDNNRNHQPDAARHTRTGTSPAFAAGVSSPTLLTASALFRFTCT